MLSKNLSVGLTYCRYVALRAQTDAIHKRCARFMADKATQSHYDVLNVEKHASPEEIKKQFIKLSKEHHPDLSSDKSGSHDKFVRLKEAYDVLSKTETRRMYDVSLDHRLNPWKAKGPFMHHAKPQPPRYDSEGEVPPYDPELFHQFDKWQREQRRQQDGPWTRLQRRRFWFLLNYIFFGTLGMMCLTTYVFYARSHRVHEADMAAAQHLHNARMGARDKTQQRRLHERFNPGVPFPEENPQPSPDPQTLEEPSQHPVQSASPSEAQRPAVSSTWFADNNPQTPEKQQLQPVMDRASSSEMQGSSPTLPELNAPPHAAMEQPPVRNAPLR